MKSKLITCLLGLTIILSSGTAVLAEGEETAPAPAVQETPAEPAQPAEPAVPVVTPADPPAEPAVDPGTASGSGETPAPGTDPASGSTEVTPPAVDPGSGTGTSSGTSAPEVTGSSASVSTSVPAAESAESNTADPAEIKDASEAKPEEEEKDKDEDKPEEVIVTGFSGIAEIVVKKKPSLKDALTLLPTVVEAHLSDGNKIYVPVDWACASDYNDAKAERFTFGSSLKKNPDGTTYNIGHPVAPGVRFPTADIVIRKSEDDKKKEEDKNARKESKDPVEEDAPLVMDDVTAANISPDEGEEQVFIYLMKELGLNQAAACGVLANIHYESGFNSHAIGDGGTSYGICQWHAGRYLSLVSFCDKIKVPYGSVEGQLKYMEQEITNGYAHVLEYLKKIPNTEVGAFDAAYYWCYHFERPAMILRQSTLRGNAAKNSYWPRYKDADPNKLEKKNQDSESSVKKLSEMEEKLDEEITEVTAEETAKETAAEPAVKIAGNTVSETRETPAAPAVETKDMQAAADSEKQVKEEYKALEAVVVQTVGEYRSAVLEQKKARKKTEMEDRISIFIPDDEDDIAGTIENEPEIEIFTSFPDGSEKDTTDSEDHTELFVY